MESPSHNREVQSTVVSVALVLLAVAIQDSPIRDSWLFSGTLFGASAAMLGWGFWRHLRPTAARIGGVVAQAPRLRLRWPVFIAPRATDPPPVPQLAAPQPPSAEELEQRRNEREAINDIRVLWTLHANKAAQLLHSLLHSLIFTSEGNPDLYWVPLLNPIERDLSAATSALDEALADGKAPLREVRQRFKAFDGAYATAVMWLGEVVERERIDLAKVVVDGQVKRWRKEHKRFREKFSELLVRPEHRGTLRGHVETMGLTAFFKFQSLDEDEPK